MFKSFNPGTNLHFIYIDRNNKISEQNGILISHKEYKFYMRCSEDNGLRSFLYPSVLLNLEGYDDSIESLINNYQANYKEHIPQSRAPREPSMLNLDNKPEIQFTGFYSVLKMDQIKTKDELVGIAKDNGYFVKKSKTLGTNVSILVCGHNAGPIKMIKASEKGSILLNEQQFLHMVENGGELLESHE
jgi:hypothetical protein|tara:strand:- start:56 stop:619 length:564 start_codon:yes stop_codon:yes gene_type:complete